MQNIKEEINDNMNRENFQKWNFHNETRFNLFSLSD